MEVEKISRHCAFCLKCIPWDEVKRCSKCHRRAYCSKECQVKDWKPKNEEHGGTRGIGQGHKSWCGVPYLEEDLDWFVTPVTGKGIGLISKKFIPAKTRIMVDGFKEIDWINEPSKAYNSLGRIKMTNHDCGANAAKMIDPDFKAMVLYSKRCIQPGEEICVNYVCYDEVYTQCEVDSSGKPLETFADVRKLLESRWGIICPSDCFCKDASVDRLIQQGRRARACIGGGGDSPYTSIDAKVNMEIVADLLDTWELVRGTWAQKAQILEIGFNIGVQRKRSMKVGEAWIKEVVEIWSSIVHPRGRLVRRVEKLMNKPESSEMYLCLKKKIRDRPF